MYPSIYFFTWPSSDCKQTRSDIGGRVHIPQHCTGKEFNGVDRLAWHSPASPRLYRGLPPGPPSPPAELSTCTSSRKLLYCFGIEDGEFGSSRRSQIFHSLKV
jgi:hypothetical protein